MFISSDAATELIKTNTKEMTDVYNDLLKAGSRQYVW